MKLRNFAQVVCFTVLTALTGCTETNCLVGNDIVIPATDVTEPFVVLDFFLPNGQTVTATPTSAPATVAAPSGSQISLLARGDDDQGVRDVQLWVATRTCTRENESETCEQPTQGMPAASNRDPGSAGDDGCSARLIAYDVTVVNTAVRSVAHDVQARALSFGGGTVRTPYVRVQAE